jgi:hypothetical protein
MGLRRLTQFPFGTALFSVFLHAFLHFLVLGLSVFPFLHLGNPNPKKDNRDIYNY